MARLEEKVLKTTKDSVVIEHPVYSDDKLVGWAKSTLFRETPEGLTTFKNSITMESLKKVNRQIKTDDKNNLRRGTSVMAALRALAKVNPTVAQIVELLVTQAQSGKFDPKMLESIEVFLKEKKAA